MKVKQRTVCQTCRTRKLGCDGEQPECGQCRLRGRQCDWDSAVWTFLPQNTHAYGARRQDARGCKESAKRFGHHSSPREQLRTCIQQNARFPANTAVEQYSSVTGPLYNDAIESIMDAFVPREGLPCIFQGSKDVPRMCGAWVGVLPIVAQTPQPRYGRVLFLGIAALSSSIKSESYAASIRTYNAAIDALRTDITLPKAILDAEVVATIMCLTLAELFLPDSRFGLAMHINGVAQFFQQNGPERFKSGVLHELFAGFRPLFMLHAFQSRTATFISSNEWICIPFANRRPSLMQTLLGQAACIPLLLQQTDTLLTSPCEASIDQATVLCNTYLELSSTMERWEQLLHCHYPGSTWDFPSNSNFSTPAPPERRVWFSDITMANVYTHLWAFRIICAAEFDRLVSLFSLTGRQYSTSCNYFSSRDVQGHNETLAALICCCMEYLIQDELKLFGPLSAMLPLQAAYKVYIADGHKNSLHVTYINDVVERLVKRGIRSAPYIIYY